MAHYIFQIKPPENYYGDKKKVTVILVAKDVLSTRGTSALMAKRFQPSFPESEIALARQLAMTKRDRRLKFKYYCGDKDIENVLNLDYRFNARWSTVELKRSQPTT